MNSIVCWLNAPTGRFEAAPVINDRRILIVKDNPDDESLTQRGLRPAGAAVVVAHDGALALETLAAMGHLPDLVLFDLKLPKSTVTRCCASDAMMRAPAGCAWWCSRPPARRQTSRAVMHRAATAL
jgi:CheY-like chemotaxis protein